MKVSIIIFSLLIPLLSKGQDKVRYSRAYLGGMLHNMDHPGVSLVNSFGFNQYVGLGAGVDLTSYNQTILVPVYADLRFKYPIKNFSPFIFGQFGKPLYNRTNGTGLYMTDITGGNRREVMLKRSGNIFAGGGLGVSYKTNGVGCFITWTIRNYKFSNQTHNIDGKEVSFMDNKTIGILTAGLVF